MSAENKVKDLELWRKWRQSGSHEDLQPLLNNFTGLINREVQRWQASMSRSLLESEGKRLAVQAMRTYDPNRGTALSTHIASRLPKLSRIVYANQNVARLSETSALLFHAYASAQNELREQHGREPSQDELCDHLGWSPKKLESFQRQAGRKEFVESEEHPDEGLAADDAANNLVDLIYSDLTPMQQKIFEYTSGYRGMPRLKGAAIMRRLKITQGILSYQKKLIVDAVKKARPHG